MARSTFCGLCAVFAVVACGPSSTIIKGPDGEDAHLISCRTTASCYEEAANLCAAGYVIREVHGVHGGGYSLLASCKSDLQVGSTVAPTEKSSDTSSERDDAKVCQAAAKFRKDFGAYWASKSGGALLDELVAPRDFVMTCQAMPEMVQRCMHEKYRSAHEQSCTAILARLDEASKTQIDALFLQVPTGKPQPTPANSRPL